MMKEDKRKREMMIARQNFIAGMCVAAVMTVAAGILCAVKLVKGDGNMKADSDIAVTIKDNLQKKAASFKDSAVHHKNEAEHVVKDLRSKVDEIKEDIKS